MLKLKGIVITKKNATGELENMATYDRVYLTHAEGDPIETVDKTVNGKVVGQITRPKDDVSLTSPEELQKQALQYLAAKYPNTHPILSLLDRADYGNDLKDQAPIRQSITPGKPIDVDKANEGMAKKLVAMGKFKTIDAALTALRALGGE